MQLQSRCHGCGVPRFKMPAFRHNNHAVRPVAGCGENHLGVVGYGQYARCRIFTGKCKRVKFLGTINNQIESARRAGELAMKSRVCRLCRFDGVRPRGFRGLAVGIESAASGEVAHAENAPFSIIPFAEVDFAARHEFRCAREHCAFGAAKYVACVVVRRGKFHYASKVAIRNRMCYLLFGLECKLARSGKHIAVFRHPWIVAVLVYYTSGIAYVHFSLRSRDLLDISSAAYTKFAAVVHIHGPAHFEIGGVGV